jgi:hypothetical protein
MPLLLCLELIALLIKNAGQPMQLFVLGVWRGQVGAGGGGGYLQNRVLTSCPTHYYYSGTVVDAC